jgi:methylated-DNA-[protein]-cysteine S-methyltransferase
MRHATVFSPFGPLTVFQRDDSLVALEWGHAPADEATSLLAEAIGQLEAYFDGSLRCFSLPLRPEGTLFQRRVWSRLTDIPYGSTENYGRLAAELGTAPRALAGACAGNPLPILIPCHRVIASGGRLGGYSGGAGEDTKRALLLLEGACPPDPPRYRPASGTARQGRTR